MIKMSFFMVLTFIVSWAPMQVITLYRFYDENIVLKKYFGALFFVCHWLAVSRSFINPFIYACNNERFRKGFVYFLCCHWTSTSSNEFESSIVQNRAFKFTYHYTSAFQRKSRSCNNILNSSFTTTRSSKYLACPASNRNLLKLNNRSLNNLTLAGGTLTLNRKPSSQLSVTESIAQLTSKRNYSCRLNQTALASPKVALI